ncbi:TUBULIN-FOLDING COFACTOR C family protein [Dorcoceras hygrometricum]|uniref:TUBULIN-FOLDING COFACTOR C family protein n=1 Tax=Dorcoceras hygrometricum TaxID=472368 RepID=A0A2Z7C1S7_9LAMI|nr:TUBULIN-FOLDING COFACTOR C family protein [Dorcoceras hygrometricum]
MKHAIINAMKCMRAIKDRIARPVYQLANHLNEPLYPHGVSTGEIIGATHLSASHNVALNQVINKSVNQAQDHRITSADFITSITAMSTLKAVKSAQFVPSSLRYLNRVLTSRYNSWPRQPDFSWLGKHGRDSLELKICTRYLTIQLNSNSTAKVLRSSSITQLPNPTEYYSTLKRGLNWKGITYPEAYNNQRTLNKISPEILVHQQLHAHFHKSFHNL